MSTLIKIAQRKFLLFNLILLLNSLTVYGQFNPGNKDNNFGTNGITYTAAGFTTNYKGSCIDSKGRIIMVGYTATGSDRDMVVVRLTAAGILDNTFDTDGIKTIAYSGNTDERAHVVTASGNKIYLAGFRINGAAVTLEVISLLKDGSFDNSFDNDGISSISIPGQNYSYPCGIFLDELNKITIAGQSAETDASDTDFCVARLTSSGSLDNTFDSDGISIVDFGQYEYPMAMIVNEGQTFVGGHMYTNATTKFDFIMMKLDGSGSLDPAFDSDGKSSYSIGSDEDELNGMALSGISHIILTGKYRTSPDNARIGMVKINKISGALDNTFGSGGYSILDVLNGNTIVGNDVAIDATGKILIAASSISDFHLVRLNSDGSYDSNFGTNGYNTIDFVPANSSIDQARCLLQDKAGRLLISGYVNFSGQTYLGISRVYNYTPDLNVSSMFDEFTSGPTEYSETQSYILEGTYIPDSIAIIPPTGYELSLDGTTFNSNTIYIPSGDNGSISPNTIYVRLKSGLSEGIYYGAISHLSNEISENVTVSGTVSSPTSVSASNPLEKLIIYPIPASSILTVENVENIQHLKILDMNSRLITENTNSNSISVESLTPGIYLLKVISNQSTFQTRIQIE